MSILNINEENFKLRVIDFMENPDEDLDVSIWTTGLNRNNDQVAPAWGHAMIHDLYKDMNTWTAKVTNEIRTRILELAMVMPSGRDIRKILKDVLGVDLSVRAGKYMIDGGTQIYYDIATNNKRAFADRFCRIETDKLPYKINSIRIAMRFPKVIIAK